MVLMVQDEEAGVGQQERHGIGMAALVRRLQFAVFRGQQAHEFKLMS